MFLASMQIIITISTHVMYLHSLSVISMRLITYSTVIQKINEYEYKTTKKGAYKFVPMLPGKVDKPVD